MRLLLARIGLTLAAFFAHPCLALAVGNNCSVSGTTTASIGNYDPFTGSSYAQAPVYLTLTRYLKGSAKTQQVDFYISQPSGSPGYAITYQGANVLYTQPSAPLLSLGSAPSGTVGYNFGGGGQPDTVTIPLNVTIPAGINLVAGAPITFNVVYICNGTGGLGNVTTPTTLANAITVQITVVSALQASYAGPALAFGEIGGLSDSQARAQSVGGAIRVASTGPFTVALSSANGFRMAYSGGSLSASAQTIRYSTRLLGQTADNAAQTFSTTVCSSVGTGGQNLPITVNLEEGGMSKMPSPNYQDTLTVTITPLAIPYGGGTLACQNLQ